MKESAEIALESLLFGFGIYSLLFLIIGPFLPKTKKHVLHKYDNSACLITAIIGGLYLLIWMIVLVTQSTDRLYGPYWFALLIQPLLFLPSQLLWFKSIRTKKLLRFLIALLLITSVESVVIYMTSLHRDYLPSSWSMPAAARISNWFISLGAFGIISVGFHALRTKIPLQSQR